MLYIGEEVGTGDGPEVDIALDPLEGTTICAKAMPNALAVIASRRPGRPAQRARHLHGQDRHRSGLSGRAGRSRHGARRERPALAKAKGVRPREITACILDRPRHAELIEAVREAGAAIRLISDGDVAGVIHTTDPEETGIDIYIGSAARRRACSPRRRCAASAARCRAG